MTINTTLRNATLADLSETLKQQQAAKIDVVAPAATLRSENGNLIVPGVATEINEDGVTAIAGEMRPTERCDSTIADRFSIPIKYLRSVRESGITVPGSANLDDAAALADVVVGKGVPEIPLLDAILNSHFAADERSVLVRGFRGDDGETGVARALLSNKFKAIDNLDALMAVLEGARRADAGIEVQQVNLSEKFMRIRFIAPAVQALAPKLLKGYRPPSGTNPYGTSDGDPIVFAGIDANNSETGGGAFMIAPVFIVQWCTNGATRTKEAVRAVHAGGRLEEGTIAWSDETFAKNIELVGSMARDAVSQFLNVDYLERIVAEAEAKADAPVKKPEETVKIVAQKLSFSDTERETLLSHFIQGGQVNAAGVFNSVTSMAQTVENPDRAAEIEDRAFEALDLVAAIR